MEHHPLRLAFHIAIPYSFNIRNTSSLITDLKELTIDEDTRLASFDIKKMYANIPTKELLDIIRSSLKNNYVDENTEK